MIGVAEVNRAQAQALRQAFGRFATGVTIVSWHDGATDQLCGMTANSFTSVSLNPPLIAWNMRDASVSLASFSTCSTYVISVLAHDQRDASAHFARPGYGDPDYFERGSADTPPVVKGALAWFECAHFAQHSAGDHILFLGQVDRWNIGSPRQPLLFFGGEYGAFTPLQK